MNQFIATYSNEVRKELKLKNEQYLVALFIQSQQLNPNSSLNGYCFASKRQIAEYLDISQRNVFSILKKLHELGLIEKHEGTKFIRTTSKFYQCQIGIPSAEVAEGMQILHKEKVAQKESIYIPVSTKQDEVPPVGRTSCPLKNPNNPLKDKYPKAHAECVEYVTSFKFVNKPKQFKFLHQMLRSGLDFPDVDRILSRVEKKPYFQENGWDFATLAGEADRRSNAHPSTE